MNFEVGYRCGEVQISIDSLTVLHKLIQISEDVAKSELINGHLEEARDVINFLLALKEGIQRMKGEEK